MALTCACPFFGAQLNADGTMSVDASMRGPRDDIKFVAKVRELLLVITSVVEIVLYISSYVALRRERNVAAPRRDGSPTLSTKV